MGCVGVQECGSVGTETLGLGLASDLAFGIGFGFTGIVDGGCYGPAQ